jgi:hypothetical protein
MADAGKATPYSRSVAARFHSYLNFDKKNCECLNLKKLGIDGVFNRLLIYDKIRTFLHNIKIPDDIEELTYASILSYIYEEIRELINNPEHGKALIECLKKDIKFEIYSKYSEDREDEGVYVRVNGKFDPVTFKTNRKFLLKLQEDMIRCINDYEKQILDTQWPHSDAKLFLKDDTNSVVSLHPQPPTSQRKSTTPSPRPIRFTHPNKFKSVKKSRKSKSKSKKSKKRPTSRRRAKRV